MSCNYNPAPRIVVIGLGYDRAMRAAARAAMRAAEQTIIFGTTADMLIIDECYEPSAVELLIREMTPMPLEDFVLRSPEDLFEPFTNVAPVYKAKCYAPTPKQAKAKKSFTCTGRIRGNYY